MRTVGLLALLYFAQGLPFGFQSTALPVWMRTHGATLSQISLAGAVALPWMFKALWAPLVDRFGSRRAWIGCCQLLLAAIAAIGAFVVDTQALAPVLAVIALLNLVAATQDIAVDGLAVDLLSARQLGWGNGAQVAGYKVGMLFGGGVLVYLSGNLGWRGLFLAMAGLFAAVGTLAWFAPAVQRAPRDDHPARLRDAIVLLFRALRAPGAAVTLGLCATYKFGETLADAMMKPFLVDSGFAAPQIGLWMGTWGMAASLAGSLLGAWWAASRGPAQALVWTALLRMPALVGQWWLAAGAKPAAAAVVGVTMGEHLCGGMLTTAMFAWLMARVDKRIGASHFTVLASVEVFGKVPPGWLSGPLTEATGYPTTFALAAGLSLLFWLAAWRWAGCNRRGGARF
jgi:MFS family permease